MTQVERLQYINMVLKFQNIELHSDLLKRVVASVDLVNKKKGETDILDMIKLKDKKL